MLVNLFDANFRQSVCSVAYQIPEHIEYVRDQMSFDGVTIFTDAYIHNPIVDEVQSRYKVAWLHEPQCLWPENYAKFPQVAHKFDLLLTYYEPSLKHPKARFCPYGGSWINKADWSIKPKSKDISMLIGSKMSTAGHKIRHDIASVILDNDLDVDLYGIYGTQTNYSQETKLKVLADYRYSIVTETCYESNLFTEILLDCFAVGTIPVFWGCPNLEDYFNTSGVAMFANLGELTSFWTELTPFNYELALSAVYDNLERMKDYAITEDWLYHNVLRELE